MREKYGEKVYKLPVNIPVSCPNRDGAIGTGGCSFCGEAGAGFENLPDFLKKLQNISEKYSIDFMVSLSADLEDLDASVRQYEIINK